MEKLLSDEEVRESLKKSYYEGFGDFNDIDVKFEDVCDFILTLRNSDRQFLRERIEEELPDLSTHEGSQTSLRFWQGYGKAIKTVLELLTPTNN